MLSLATSARRGGAAADPRRDHGVAARDVAHGQLHGHPDAHLQLVRTTRHTGCRDRLDVRRGGGGRDAARPCPVLQRRRDRAPQPFRTSPGRDMSRNGSHEVPSIVTEPTTRQDARIPEMTEQGPVDIDLAVGRADHDAVSASDDHVVVFGLDELSVYYGDFRAVRGVTVDVHEHEITAFIGPSGCGKTTVLRSLNRMNDFIETRPRRGQGAVPRRRPVRVRRSTRSRSDAGSGWCSRSRTRSPSRSTTTSPSGRACTGVKKKRRARRHRRAVAPRRAPCGTRSRTA